MWPMDNGIEEHCMPHWEDDSLFHCLFFLTKTRSRARGGARGLGLPWRMGPKGRRAEGRWIMRLFIYKTVVLEKK